MKKIHIFMLGSLFALSSCSERLRHSEPNKNLRGSSDEPAQSKAMLLGEMNIPRHVSLTDSIGLTFTVYNSSQKKTSFCIWHTPFEKPMSKYLNIVDANNQEIPYKGVMAKRIMPPPPSAYVSLKGGSSRSVIINLLRSYGIDKPGKYTVRYNSSSISGIKVRDSVSFMVLK